MIDEYSYDDLTIDSLLSNTEEYYDSILDDYVDKYQLLYPVKDILNNNGITFPSIQNLITELYQDSVNNSDGILIEKIGNTEIYLTAYAGHLTYEEEVYVSLTLSAWTDNEEYDENGGDMISICATWYHECDPANEAEIRRILRMLYEQLIQTWNNVYPAEIPSNLF